MENVEIRAYFHGPHVSDSTSSHLEELQGRIDALDSAISILQKRNEVLAVQINEKDLRLVDAHRENMTVQRQLKSADECLRETILRLAAEKNALQKRALNSPYAENSHFNGSFRKRRNQSFPRSDHGNSYSTLPQFRIADEKTAINSPPRRKSEYPIKYPITAHMEQSVRRKSLKLREYARTRLREMKPVTPLSADCMIGCSSEMRDRVHSWSIQDPVISSFDFDESSKNEVPDVMIL